MQKHQAWMIYYFPRNKVSTVTALQYYTVRSVKCCTFRNLVSKSHHCHKSCMYLNFLSLTYMKYSLSTARQRFIVYIYAYIYIYIQVNACIKIFTSHIYMYWRDWHSVLSTLQLLPLRMMHVDSKPSTVYVCHMYLKSHKYPYKIMKHNQRCFK